MSATLSRKSFFTMRRPAERGSNTLETSMPDVRLNSGIEFGRNHNNYPITESELPTTAVATSHPEHQLNSVDSATSALSSSRKRKIETASEEDFNFDDARPLFDGLIQRNIKRRSLTSKSPCLACLENVPEKALITVECQCRDRFCKPCFNAWIVSQLQQGAGWLPKCCGVILRYAGYSDALWVSTKRLYENTVKERSAKNPLYCGKHNCGTFLQTPSSPADGYATCSKCKSKTCVGCRRLKRHHLGIHHLCPVEDPMMVEVSKAKGWMRCPKCFVWIEKHSGCDEIRCLCKCLFKFCCGQLVRKCVCQKSGE